MSVTYGNIKLPPFSISEFAEAFELQDPTTGKAIVEYFKYLDTNTSRHHYQGLEMYEWYADAIDTYIKELT